MHQMTEQRKKNVDRRKDAPSFIGKRKENVADVQMRKNNKTKNEQNDVRESLSKRKRDIIHTPA